MGVEKISVPFAVIIASCIIIVMTSGLTDKNGLSALIGGYYGLLLGILFVVIIKNYPLYPIIKILDLVPFIIIMMIILILIYYLTTYFDKISTGDVSGYYNSFSGLSTLFLATQLLILFSELFRNSTVLSSPEKKISSKMFALLVLLGTINFLVVITIGIVLKFYSTQG